MAHRLRTRDGDGMPVAVDARDVAAWSGAAWTGSADAAWAERGERYVRAHPRRGSAGIGAAQRLVLLRRLAAGPASAGDLLAVLRAVGWVGASDLENRLRDLRAGDARAGAAQTGVRVVVADGRYALAEPFPALDEADRRAIGFAKAMVGQLQGPLASAAAAVLEQLAPGVGLVGGGPGAATVRARAADYQRFEAARLARQAVRVRYFSLNSGREGRYLLVPVDYVTLGATVKAICVRVGPDGRRSEAFDRQLALDRLLEVGPPDADPPVPRTPARDLVLRTSPLVLDLSPTLYEVLRQRDVFGLADTTQATALGYEDAWRVRGTFPVALAWDVMEQLCAWAGQVQVREPLWLVNAVVRRLRAGLRVMDEGAGFVLVKPEPERSFADMGEAIRVDAPLPQPSGPRKLAPPG